MKKQLLSLALLSAAWLASGSALAHDGDHSYTNGICTIEGCTDKYQAPALVDDWYELTNAGNVEWFAAQVNGGQTLLKAKLTDNIDFTDVSHTPIGYSTGQKYTGEFDGQKFEIRNLKSFTTTNPVGLFGYLRATSTDAAYIHDLVIAESCEISGTNNVGGIAGSMQSATGGNNNSAVIRIENCINNASVTSSNGVASGILGAGTSPYPKLSLKNCLNTGHIKATNNKGSAFCSWQNNSPIYVTSCWNIGVVEGNKDSKNLVVYGNTNNSTGWCTFTNCYDMCTADGHLTRTQGQQGSLTTDSPLASGELCYNLNGDQSEIGWKQRLLVHDMPQLFEGDQVYKNATYLCPDKTNGEVEYSNSNNSVIPPHDYVDGVCSVCSGYEVPTIDNEYYQLNNYGKVKWFESHVNDGHPEYNAELLANINFKGNSCRIGNGTYPYKGIFKGNDHVISNFTIDNDQMVQGFFGFITGGADISGLILDNTCSISCTAKAGVIGMTKGSGTVKLTRIGNEGPVTVTKENAAGIIGSDDGGYCVLQIDQCYSTGTIVGGKESAQIAGWTGDNSLISNSWSCAEVTGVQSGLEFSRYGGDNHDAQYENCFTTYHETNTGLTYDTPAAKFASGEVAYTINKNAGEEIFYQLLGTDDHPSLDSSRGQVILNGSYENVASTLALNDENSFGTNSDFDVTSVTMTRTLKGEKWNTFCVPFDMEISELGTGAEVKELTGATLNGENYNMTFRDATSIVAGKPYMVRVPNEVTSLNLGAKTIKGTITPATAGDVTFTGVYNNGNAPQGSFIISNNVFYNVDSTVALKAFRGYITTTSGNNVKALTFDFDDDATGISLMEDGRSQMEDGAIYNIDGQRINKMQKGINIVNGKKILK